MVTGQGRVFRGTVTSGRLQGDGIGQDVVLQDGGRFDRSSDDFLEVITPAGGMKEAPPKS
ncbi:hypothetical protein GCM10010264_18520 [Streptomyces globisporus]|nr:hypothetical protein GCM10010264_18520 [Streptomyces globisporus]